MRQIKLSEILSIYKATDATNFLKNLTNVDLSRSLRQIKLDKNFPYLNDNYQNASNVEILKYGEKGLIERITNAIDAVIAKEKISKNYNKPSPSIDDIIKNSFPRYWAFINSDKLNENRMKSLDAANKVSVTIHDGTTLLTQPTIDVLDAGTGIPASKFKNTILRINGGNKGKITETYQLGAFGQGGHTSMAFCKYTIIISKYENRYAFSIVGPVEVEENKNASAYVYLVDDEKNVIELVNDIGQNADSYPENVRDFINNESGTLIRMIDFDISDKDLIKSDVSKGLNFKSYIDSQLFSVKLPVKIIENRLNYRNNESNENRYSYGSLLNLKSLTKFRYKEGTLNINIKVAGSDEQLKLDYYIILPEDEKDWSNVSKCREIFQRFNYALTPIIYTVSGQTITDERFLRLKNKSLFYLEYRLLVRINLDSLGKKKYKIFTTSREELKKSADATNLIEQVIDALANMEELQELNKKISEMSSDANSIDKNKLAEISKKVGKQLLRLANPTVKPNPNPKPGPHPEPDDPKNYYSEFKEFNITDQNNKVFYSDQVINIHIKTQAQKFINQQAKIDMFVNEQGSYKFRLDPNRKYNNGWIVYSFEAHELQPGKYDIYFLANSNDKDWKSNVLSLEILKDKTPIVNKPDVINRTKFPDIVFDLKGANEAFVSLEKDNENKVSTIHICWEPTGDYENKLSEILNKYKIISDVEIAKAKEWLVYPICLFVVLYSPYYDSIESVKQRNELIINSISSFLYSRDEHSNNN